MHSHMWGDWAELGRACKECDMTKHLKLEGEPGRMGEVS